MEQLMKKEIIDFWNTGKHKEKLKKENDILLPQLSTI